MTNEIKEIKVNKANKSITFINNGIGFSQLGIADEILDLITNLQEENERLKKANELLQNNKIEEYEYTYGELLDKVIYMQQKTKNVIEMEQKAKNSEASEVYW